MCWDRFHVSYGALFCAILWRAWPEFVRPIWFRSPTSILLKSKFWDTFIVVLMLIVCYNHDILVVSTCHIFESAFPLHCVSHTILIHNPIIDIDCLVVTFREHSISKKRARAIISWYKVFLYLIDVYSDPILDTIPVSLDCTACHGCELEYGDCFVGGGQHILCYITEATLYLLMIALIADFCDGSAIVSSIFSLEKLTCKRSWRNELTHSASFFL